MALEFSGEWRKADSGKAPNKKSLYRLIDKAEKAQKKALIQISACFQAKCNLKSSTVYGLTG